MPSSNGAKNIRSRFAVTFAANTVRSLLNFATGLVVARAMGPERYGDVVFLLGSFEAVRQVVSMGTENAFFTFISRREQGIGFIVTYCGWQLLQLALTFIMVGVLLPAKWFDAIWLGHDRSIVLLACVAVFCQSQAWQTVMQIGEAKRLTARVQILNMSVAVAHFTIVAAAAWLGELAVRFLLGILIAEYLLASSVGGWLLFERKRKSRQRMGRWPLREWIGEYAAYCAPLLFYSLGSFLFEFSNKWLLQRFGGGEQQGLFAVASQFSAACLLATTSMVRILWKEAAELHHQGDHEGLRTLYESTSRMLYGFGAALGGFLWPWSATIAVLALGEDYRQAWLPLAFLFLYPAHQSLGQVMQTLFLATGKTLSYFWIGMTFMMVSIPVTYVLLAPASAPVSGMGLGAVGMAWKTLVLNAIFVNVYIWYLCRRQGWKMASAYQPAVLAWSVAAGGAAYWLAVRSPIMANMPMAVQIPACGLVYGLLQLAFLIRFPEWFGISRETLSNLRRGMNIFGCCKDKTGF